MASLLTVQTILDRFLPEEPLDGHRLKVCARLTGCRTARMGGMEVQCDHCKARSVCYYGCRDRHCPQCQGRASQRWSNRQRALSRRFRGRMVSLLRVSANAGELYRVTNSGEVDGLLDGLMQQEWVVYTRHCLNQADTVVDYLARYTHRIAISNGRLLSMEGDRISFRYKDYRDHGRLKTQWLEGQEFVRRFLMHILPKGFMRIRHFGYLSNRTRRQKLAVIRQCLLQPPQPESNRVNQEPPRCWPCLRCNDGLVHMVRQIPRFRIVAVPTG
ncbi:IS91 family transposase [Marinobacter santoriniensis]|nr:transposase [Marinobacter santoriniensis]